MEMEFIKMIFVSAAVGGLIGIERELKVEVVAGMRTFMLVSLLGTLSVFLSDIYGAVVLALAFSGVILVTILFGVVKNFKLGDIGVTTLLAFLITFILGVMVGLGHYLDSIAAGLVVTGILVSKKYSKEFSETLEPEEIINALEFGLIAFILYPLVPDEPIDPLNLINPRILILAVIVVASIGFGGFVALRRVGPDKGLPVIGALGGLVNSEFTASALSTRVGEKIEMLRPALLGIILANTVMLARNLILAGLISFEVFRLMLLPQLAMIFGGALYSQRIRPSEKPTTELSLESPFAIMPAVRFAVLFALVSFVIDYIQKFGVGGVYLASLLGGLVSSGAVTASMASLTVLGSINPSVAAFAIVVSSMGSVFVKMIIARAAGADQLTKELIKPSVLIVSLGFLLLFIQFQ